jgi:hypothetical protein
LSENFGTPFGEYISLGIHESQSRFWENVVARSPEFAKFAFPFLKKSFPKAFTGRTSQDFFEIASSVETVLPRLVQTDKEGFKSLATSGMTPYMVKAIQELAQENSDLKKTNTDLLKRLEKLEAIVYKK